MVWVVWPKIQHCTDAACVYHGQWLPIYVQPSPIVIRRLGRQNQAPVFQDVVPMVYLLMCAEETAEDLNSAFASYLFCYSPSSGSVVPVILNDDL